MKKHLSVLNFIIKSIKRNLDIKMSLIIYKIIINEKDLKALNLISIYINAHKFMRKLGMLNRFIKQLNKNVEDFVKNE